jgi:hypothetical protein
MDVAELEKELDGQIRRNGDLRAALDLLRKLLRDPLTDEQRAKLVTFIDETVNRVGK